MLESGRKRGKEREGGGCVGRGGREGIGGGGSVMGQE